MAQFPNTTGKIICEYGHKSPNTEKLGLRTGDNKQFPELVELNLVKWKIELKFYKLFMKLGYINWLIKEFS